MSAIINYTKGHGTKNDFVLIEDINDTLKLTEKQIRNAAINILAYIYGNDKWDTYVYRILQL